MAKRGRPRKQTDEPNDEQMRSAERYAQQLQKRADKDIEELRKQLAQQDDYDE